MKHIKILLFFAFLLCITRLPFLVFIYRDCYSVDLGGWKEVLSVLDHGQNPYTQTRFLNWPPLWLIFLFILNKIAHWMHLPFDIELRCFLLLMDFVVAAVIFKFLHKHYTLKATLRTIVIGYILNPVVFFLTVQHGNFDVLVGLLILGVTFQMLKFYKFENSLDWLIGCCFLGIGIFAKTVPIVLLPIVFGTYFNKKSNQKNLKELGLGLFLILFPVVLSLSVLYVLAPVDITEKVLNYRSTIAYGFGFPWVLSLFQLESWISVYKVIFGLSMLGVVFFVSRNITQILSSTIVLLMSIVVLGPGHGNQYVLWFLPLLLIKLPSAEGLTRRVMIMFLFVLAMTYSFEYMFLDYLGQSLLWYHKNSVILNQISGLIKFSHHGLFRLPLFISYLVLYLILIREMSRAPSLV